VMPGSTLTTVRSANDLKPLSTMDSSRMGVDNTEILDLPRENHQG
jgi:hypothetical protein